MVVNNMNFEDILYENINQVSESTVKSAMIYSLMAGGKRIRPTLLYAVLKGYGIDERIGDHFASALEMIHTYSLIHDDLPAMDNDDLRRGKPTCHKQFNECTAILAGDGLLTYAFDVAAHSHTDSFQTVKGIQILAAMAGPDGMVLGQCFDTEENEEVNWESLKNIHHLKTGCLLSAPLMIAAIIANQSDETVNTWHRIGNMIGLAFQVQDDIFDVTMSAEQLGKSNSDEENNKVTSVTLLGLEKAKEVMNSLYDESIHAIQNLKDFDGTEILSMIENLRTRNI